MKTNYITLKDGSVLPTTDSKAGNRKVKKLVHGVGTNDWKSPVNTTIDGKRYRDIYYMTWVSMLQRSYDKKLHKRFPTYKDCTVSSEWLVFSNFRRWMVKQDWVGKQLDKDIIFPENKHYSEGRCVFIPHSLNTLLSDNKATRGKYPQGVTYHKHVKKFMTGVAFEGNNYCLGYFDTPEEASIAYVEKKVEILEYTANNYKGDKVNKVKRGLELHAELLYTKD